MKKPLSELTQEEWEALVTSGMAYEFYPEGPPTFETEDGTDSIIKMGEDSE